MLARERTAAALVLGAVVDDITLVAVLAVVALIAFLALHHVFDALTVLHHESLLAGHGTILCKSSRPSQIRMIAIAERCV